LNALTRIFVVALVVCSLLMSAAVVVFVSRVDDFNKTATQAIKDRDAARNEASAALNQVASVRAASEEREQAANTRVAAVEKDLLTAKQQLADKGVESAEKAKELALANLEAAHLSEALKASEATKAQLLQQVATLRTTTDDTTKKNSDLNAAVSDLTNKLQVTDRERQYLSEQLTELQATSAKQASALKGAGLGTEEQMVNVKPSAPAINGTVKEVRQLNQIPYATISVGSADNVTKGMQFNVIDMRRGTFLGILTIDSVDANESVGRLQGPHVNDIRPGVEVRTQL
jgi:hypothetical protein